MWLINALVGMGFIIFLGFTILPAFKLILDTFYEDVVLSLPRLTAFESVVMGLYPIAIFLAILFGALLAIIRIKRKRD